MCLGHGGRRRYRPSVSPPRARERTTGRWIGNAAATAAEAKSRPRDEERARSSTAIAGHAFRFDPSEAMQAEEPRAADQFAPELRREPSSAVSGVSGRQRTAAERGAGELEPA
jgi:hypothetical protein